jgi:protocatechuate 3,4-dioxygenase beta subunit
MADLLVATPAYLVEPVDPATQALRVIPGYIQTGWRTPERFWHRPLTLSELTGPSGHSRRLSPLGADIAGEGDRQALGQLIHVRLAVVDQDGSPVGGAMVEMWQANAAGRYAHPNDTDHAPLDPRFDGAARVVTDESGSIEFRTIKPGGYPVPNSGRWWRPPHIHFSVWGRSFLSRMVTQMFFPGEPLNGQDHILLSVASSDAREALIARALPTTEGPDDTLVFAHRIVVRGRRATPSAH